MSRKKFAAIVAAAVAFGAALMEILKAVQKVLGEPEAAADSTVVAVTRFLGIG